MQPVLIVVHLMIVVVLVAVVLLQRSEGGALGVGSTGGFLTGRGQANALTRATAILAALFFLTSLALTFIARLNQAPEVTFQSITPVEPEKSGTAQQGEGKASLFDQLRQMEEQPSRPPGLPPGVTMPGQPGAPAAPQGQSVLETKPAGLGGVDLPPQKSPPTPLTTLAPGASGLPALPEPAPEAKPLPFKQAPASAPPWQK